MMKKILAAVLSLMLLFCTAFAFAETEDFRTFCNPENYNLILVSDVYIMEEDGSLNVQGCFGKLDYSNGEADIEFIGFDQEEIFTLTVAEDAELLFPADLMNPVENEPIEDLSAWYENLKAAFGPEADFLMMFEMTEDGTLTALTYYYLP